jgi:hypothetical protein
VGDVTRVSDSSDLALKRTEKDREGTEESWVKREYRYSERGPFQQHLELLIRGHRPREDARCVIETAWLIALINNISSGVAR